jgi:hypothetical protein
MQMTKSDRGLRQGVSRHPRPISVYDPRANPKFLLYTKDEASQAYVSSNCKQLDTVKKPYAVI